MRAVRALVLAALLLVLVPWGGPSTAAESAATATGSISKDILVIDNTWGVSRQTATAPVTDATTEPDGEVVLSSSAFVRLVPPTGQRFVSGTTYSLAADRSESQGSLTNACRTYAGQDAALKSGTLTVDDVQYDGDSVTRIAASWQAECATSNGSTTSQGFIRLATDAPHPLVAPEPVQAPEAGLSKPVDASLTFTNTGNESTAALGQATSIRPSLEPGTSRSSPTVVPGSAWLRTSPARSWSLSSGRLPVMRMPASPSRRRAIQGM